MSDMLFSRVTMSLQRLDGKTLPPLSVGWGSCSHALEFLQKIFGHFGGVILIFIAT